MTHGHAKNFNRQCYLQCYPTIIINAYWALKKAANAILYDHGHVGQGRTKNGKINISQASRMIFRAFWSILVCGLDNIGQGHMQKLRYASQESLR